MRQWLTTNTGLKVVAVVLAIFIWFFVKTVTSDQRTVEGVPVEVKAPPGMTVAYTTPKTVNVTVRGSTEDLRLASRLELFAVVDFQRGDTLGRQVATISTRNIRHPRRVQVVAVDPTNIIVRLERAAE